MFDVNSPAGGVGVNVPAVNGFGGCIGCSGLFFIVDPA
jgi:hypothetical protein